jgi:hypothetical protein
MAFLTRCRAGTLNDDNGAEGNRSGLNYLQGTVVITVVAVRMMQMPINEIINVVSMRHRLMTATMTVNVVRFMAAALMWSAEIGIAI